MVLAPRRRGSTLQAASSANSQALAGEVESEPEAKQAESPAVTTSGQWDRSLAIEGAAGTGTTNSDGIPTIPGRSTRASTP
jgi:hypothetical protein